MFAFLCPCAELEAAEENLNSLLEEAMKALEVGKGSSGLCVLTNAPYAHPDIRTQEAYIKSIDKAVGCSVKKGNLLFFRRPENSPLLFALFNKNTGICKIIRPDSQEKISTLSINRDMVVTPDFWLKAKQVLDESDVFSIVSILGAWWSEAPHDFLACAQAHGHVCPGLAFGYFIGKTIQRDYPLRQGQTYVFVANNPSFCGNDAVRVLLNVAEEKKNFISKEFAEGESNEWSIQDGAGACVIWDKEKNEGQGVVVGINLPEIGEVTGFRKPAKKSQETIAAVFFLIPYLDQYQKFSTVRWRASVNAKTMERLRSVSEDPYKIVGLR